jgi:polynucleotide 5'-kinase involved in rRNA processing
VGPTDSGKSTISKILIGYATRKGHSPTYVDLDIGQGSITIPGAIAAVTMDLPVPAEVQCISSSCTYHPIGPRRFCTSADLVFLWTC